MRFLLDESADGRLRSLLIDRGHDVETIARHHRIGISDEEVLAIAQRENRILITKDLDFGHLVFWHRLPHAGVILFRLRTDDVTVLHERMNLLLDQYSDRIASFIVVSERAVRMSSPTND